MRYSKLFSKTRKEVKAALVPVPKDLLTKKRSIADYAGFMGSKGESGIELENRIRRNKKERDYVKKLIS